MENTAIGNVWVFIEQEGGKIADVSLELVSKGRELADRLGVARAGVSHILSGRNRPGFDFLEAMAIHFPDISMDWLLTGKGRMYKDASPLPPENPEFAEKHTPRRVSKILVFYDDNTFEEFQ